MTNSNEQSQGQTKKCPKCQEYIQIGAKKCKHCGADLRNWFVRHKIITGILIIFVIGIIGSATNDEKKDTSINSLIINNVQEIEKEEPKEEVIKIAARELYAKYEANEIQADELYKNKLLEVSGIIENISKDIFDAPYIALKTDNVIGSVQCMLADSEKSKAAELSRGESIIIEGNNSGKMINVILRNCKIKQKK